eukprot:CAMPEP_0119537344 /NCGR_PEP_ID=MMETSP1344-20130328/50032_1 /TAXON_ID=236787 /ORGANISM="Florenciella parvula, Strain CCMP2471" /LENGTH=100 /DNA_ID=CAMNT_0007579815 /DNA_START=72 /DNA_END=370 /DNA_ORIENTATION=-
MAPSDWQWKQRWVSSGAASFFPFLLVLPLPFLVGLELLLALGMATTEASVGRPPPSEVDSDVPPDAASDAARAPLALFGGMVALTLVLTRVLMSCTPPTR